MSVINNLKQERKEPSHVSGLLLFIVNYTPEVPPCGTPGPMVKPHVSFKLTSYGKPCMHGWCPFGASPLAGYTMR